MTERKIIICYFVSAIIALLQNHRWQRTCIHGQSCNPSGHQVQLLDHPDKNYKYMSEKKYARIRLDMKTNDVSMFWYLCSIARIS